MRCTVLLAVLTPCAPLSTAAFRRVATHTDSATPAGAAEQPRAGQQAPAPLLAMLEAEDSGASLGSCSTDGSVDELLQRSPPPPGASARGLGAQTRRERATPARATPGGPAPGTARRPQAAPQCHSRGARRPLTAPAPAPPRL